MQSSKECSKCKEHKLLTEFHKRKGTEDGLQYSCKSCRSKAESLFRHNNLETIQLKNKQQYEKHKTKILVQKKDYHKNNRDVLLKKCRERYQRNKELYNAKRRQKYAENTEFFKNKVINYKKENIEKVRIRQANYTKKRSSLDLNFKLSRSLRSRIRHAVRNDQRTGSAVRDLGCSITEFKTYIERQFKPEMSWDNYGITWHLDHIKPLSKFNLQDPIEFKQAVHFSNYQPMLIVNNLKKGNRLPKVYFLFGLFGSGKTTLVNSLKDKFHVFSYDDSRMHPIELMCNPPDFDKPILYESPMLVSSFFKLSKDFLDVVPIFLDEEPNVIFERLKFRDGELNEERAIKRRSRLKKLSSKVGAFVGNYEEVKNFLNSITSTSPQI